MKAIYLMLPVVFGFSCGGETVITEEAAPHEKMAVSGVSRMADGMEEMTVPATEQLPEPDMMRQVITTGSLHFRSVSIDRDDQLIRSILPHFGAHIQNENQSRSPQRIDYSMTIRVPTERYSDLLDSIASLDIDVEQRSSNLEDVTGRYYDLKTRIANKEALEKRYLELLEKATAVRDMLEIERNLNSVRTEIEQMQGQLNLLNNRISLSTLHVSFYEELPYEYRTSGRKGFFARVLAGMDKGWQGFLTFVVIIFQLWPFWILSGLLVLMIRKILARKK